MFDMINIFEVFLPQLLRYPNPTDPLNGEAAALLIREPKSYDAKVKGAFPLLVPTGRQRVKAENTWTAANRRNRVRSKVCQQGRRRRGRSRD